MENPILSINKQSKTNWNQWWGVVGAGYLLVIVFAVGYFVAANEAEELGAEVHITIGILLAAPFLVAFLWDRLRTVKVLGVEIALSESTADLLPLGGATLVDAVAKTQYFSENPEILEKVREALQAPNRLLLEINLHAEAYWWSTRLFLEAALLDDHSQVRCLVFVEGNEERRYVGMASPRLVREGLAESMTCLEKIYQDLVNEHLSIEGLIDRWTQSTFEGTTEEEAKSLITGDKLRSLLGTRLETTAIHRSGREGPLIHYKVLYRGDRFVPVVNDGRLERVVDADDLARQWSLASLENALS